MPPELLITIVIVLFAALVQTVTGFGFGLIVVGLLSLVSPVKSAAVMNVMPALAVNMILAWRLRSHLRWPELIPIALAAVCCTPVGVLLLSVLDPRMVNGMLAAVLLATVIQPILLRQSHRPWHRTWLGVPMGMLSGILCGAYGTGGPPLVAYVHSHKMDRYRHVASLQVLLGMAGLMRLVSLIWQQSMTAQQWIGNAVGAIVVLPGIWVGLRLLGHLPEKWIRRIIVMMLCLLMLHALWRAMS